MCYKGREISQDLGNKQESPDNRELVIEAIENRKTVLKNREIIQENSEIILALKFALLLEDQGHLLNAATHYKKIIKSEKIMHRYNDPVVLFCEEKLASIYRDNGSYKDAKSLYEKYEKYFLEGKITVLGKNNVLTLQSVAGLARFLSDQGDYERALSIIQDSLRSEKQSFYQNISRVKLISVLAAIFMDLRNLRLSLWLSRNVLSACEVLLGPHDPFTLNQASNLALVLSELGKYRFAEMIDRRVLDALEKKLGSNHPQSLEITKRLANNLRFQKLYKPAVKLFVRTLRVQENQLGSLHPQTLSTKCGLASTYALQDRFSDSKILLRQVNNQYTKILSEEHPNRLWTAKALEYLQMIDNPNSTTSILESDMSDKSGDGYQVIKRHFSATSLREVAKMNIDAEYGAELVQNAIHSLVGTSLHNACFHGHEKTVESLMHLNGDIDVQVGLFGTPLCVASLQGHTSIVKLLVDAGANPDAQKTLHGSPLRAAVMMNHVNVVRSLLQGKANPNIVDHWFGTPLHEASMAGQSDAVNLLLEFAAKPNLQGGIFGFALLASAWEGNANIVKSLIQKGAFLDAQEEGKTALYWAQVEEHDEIVKTLRRAAVSRDTAIPRLRDPEAASERIDVVLKPENLVEEHQFALSAPNSDHDDNIGEPPTLKNIKENSICKDDQSALFTSNSDHNDVFDEPSTSKDMQEGSTSKIDSVLSNGHMKGMKHAPGKIPEPSGMAGLAIANETVNHSKVPIRQKLRSFFKPKGSTRMGA